MTESNLNQEIETLFKANVHLGHRKNRMHPRAKKYVYKMINGSAIIDLTQTVEQLNKAKKFLTAIAKEGKIVLIVATKKIINQFTAEISQKNNLPYITNKWMPGLLTNFDTIMKNVKRMNQLEEDKKNGVWSKFVKHEMVQLDKELNKFKKYYSGISKITKRPDALLIVDIRREKNALKEAREFALPTVSILDTNSDPTLVTYPIVANDDSASSVELLLKELITAYTESKEVKKEEIKK